MSKTSKIAKTMTKAAACVAASVLAGCGSFSPFAYTCAEPGDFAAVEERPLLKVPPGKDAPDTRAALAIPPLDRPEPPLGEQARCLDEPPLDRPGTPGRPQA